MFSDVDDGLVLWSPLTAVLEMARDFRSVVPRRVRT